MASLTKYRIYIEEKNNGVSQERHREHSLKVESWLVLGRKGKPWPVLQEVRSRDTGVLQDNTSRSVSSDRIPREIDHGFSLLTQVDLPRLIESLYKLDHDTGPLAFSWSHIQVEMAVYVSFFICIIQHTLPIRRENRGPTGEGRQRICFSRRSTGSFYSLSPQLVTSLLARILS
jgi:hypothetical protein